jgi:hypothetical protein
MSIGMVGFSWVRLRLSVGVGSGGGRRPRETMQILRTYQFEGYHILWQLLLHFLLHTDCTLVAPS